MRAGGEELYAQRIGWAWNVLEPQIRAIHTTYGDVAANTGVDLDTPDKRLSLAISEYGPMEESTELATYSALDKSRAESADGNYTVPDGFGPLLARFANGFSTGVEADDRLVLAMQTPIVQVDYQGATATLTTQAQVQAGGFDAVIVTVPTPIIASGRLAFAPDLPEPVGRAFLNLPLGSYKKCCFRFQDPISPAPDLLTRQVYVANAEGVDVWRINFASAGRIVLAYAAGDFARRLDGQDVGTLWPLVQAALTTAGYPVAANPLEVVTTNWTNDPYTLGAYSYARPGQATARNTLQEPIADKVWFAGEATSIPSYGSAHGAYESGRRAAADILRRLG